MGQYKWCFIDANFLDKGETNPNLDDYDYMEGANSFSGGRELQTQVQLPKHLLLQC